MRILSGIMPATSGSAWVSGVAVAHNPYEVKQRIGYMPENNPLPDDMRVVEYLRFRARLKGVSRRKLRDTVARGHGDLRPGTHGSTQDHWHTFKGIPPTRRHRRRASG